MSAFCLPVWNLTIKENHYFVLNFNLLSLSLELVYANKLLRPFAFSVVTRVQEMKSQVKYTPIGSGKLFFARFDTEMYKCSSYMVPNLPNTLPSHSWKVQIERNSSSILRLFKA